MLVFVALVSAGAEAGADALRDRYPYVLELAGGALLGADFSADGEVLAGPTGRLEFYAPVASEVLAGGGLWLDSSGEWIVLAGIRQISTLDRWQTRLDLQLAAGLTGGVSVGGRLGAGAGYHLGSGWRVGPAVGLAFFGGRVRVLSDLAVHLSYSW